MRGWNWAKLGVREWGGDMVRHNLAARSLRHLRFARRMMAGQPLLARASYGHHATAYVSLDGYQLPMGRVLRRLPLSDLSWTESATPDNSLAANSAANDVRTAPAETVLRLLPRLPENATTEIEIDLSADMAAWPTPPAITDEPLPQSSTNGAPPIPPTPPVTESQPPARLSIRPDGRRPHSRIVELPGFVSLPVAGEASEEDSPLVARDNGQPDTHEEGGADVAMDAQPDDQTLLPQSLPALDELPAVVSEEPAPAPVVETLPAPAPRRRGGKRAAAPPPTRASDALFPPTDADRTPQTWLARLRQAESPTPPIPPAPTKTDSAPSRSPGQPSRPSGQGKGGQTPRASQAPAQHTPMAPAQPPTAVEQPATLPDSSRAALRTMTGVDPANVRIYRGPLAERLTTAQNADALTDGSAIALGAGHATDTPETLGLLAHELTHVAQRRNPRFVPPIVQAPLGQQRDATPSQVSQPQRDSQPQSQPTTSPVDEESQAAWVEARVTSIARMRDATPIAAGPVAAEQLAPSEQTPRKRRPQDGARDVWGTLPAPWEPLPEWLTSPSSAPRQPGQSAPIAQPASPTSVRAPSSETPGTQRAERGRALPSVEGEEASHAASAHGGGAPEPDLDALAQQVHAILKRRLAAERRRFG